MVKCALRSDSTGCFWTLLFAFCYIHLCTYVARVSQAQLSAVKGWLQVGRAHEVVPPSLPDSLHKLHWMTLKCCWCFWAFLLTSLSRSRTAECPCLLLIGELSTSHQLLPFPSDPGLLPLLFPRGSVVLYVFRIFMLESLCKMRFWCSICLADGMS